MILMIQGPFHMLYQKGKIQIQKTFKNVSKWIHMVFHKNFYRNNSRIG